MKQKPRKNKRPNPAFAGLEKMLARSAGTILIQETIKDATLEEIMLLSALAPMALKLIRSGGKEGVTNALDKLYPDGLSVELPGIGELRRPEGVKPFTHQCEDCGRLYSITDPVIMPICGQSSCFGNLKPIPAKPNAEPGAPEAT